MSKDKKYRADRLLCEQGHAESREQAKRLILAGKVRDHPDRRVLKPSLILSADTQLIVEEGLKYVSRGALKLQAALDAYLPDLSGLTALDIGASTGGFTDLMLQRGASRIYAVDAGHGQMHQRLRDNPRVVCMERKNARYLSAEDIPEKADLFTMDVSFISATLLLSPVAALLKRGAWGFVLVKPQFEAERKNVGKGGVVRDPDIRQACILKVADCAENLAPPLRKIDIMHSSVKGPKGNVESILVLKSDPPTAGVRPGNCFF